MKGAIPTGLGTGEEQPRFVPPTIEELVAKFPQLEIMEFIGQGGMGAVYKVRQRQLDRIVALKILPPHATDSGFAKRFTREARAMAKLNHPHIVTLYEFGQAEGLFFFLMEFVDGLNLQQFLQRGRVPAAEALAIVPQICDALQFAHQQGIVHRDIKPGNILLSKAGRVKIADFGVAKIVAEGGREEAVAGEKAAPITSELTQAGSVVGTPQYMAPEQLAIPPAEVDHRVDIYALGVVFYQLLTGELPGEQLQPPSHKVQIDVRLDEVVLQALEKNPRQRYQTVGEMKTAVETIAATTGGSAPGTSADANPEPGPPPANPETLAGEILARDYQLNILHCVRRGWNLVKSNFWLLVGSTALVLILLSAVSSSDKAASAVTGSKVVLNLGVVGVLLTGPFMGGLFSLFLKRIRNQPANVESAFGGFKKPFLQLLLAGLVTSVLTGLGFVCLVLPGIYLLVAWSLTHPLVIDKALDFWPAMELSRKIITQHWWKFLLFLLTMIPVNLAGLLCCGVGIFVSIPVSVAALMYVYEDILHPAPPKLPV
jgi:serine/threonine protein kinase